MACELAGVDVEADDVEPNNARGPVGMALPDIWGACAGAGRRRRKGAGGRWEIGTGMAVWRAWPRTRTNNAQRLLPPPIIIHFAQLQPCPCHSSIVGTDSCRSLALSPANSMIHTRNPISIPKPRASNPSYSSLPSTPCRFLHEDELSSQVISNRPRYLFVSVIPCNYPALSTSIVPPDSLHNRQLLSITKISLHEAGFRVLDANRGPAPSFLQRRSWLAPSMMP